MNPPKTSTFGLVRHLTADFKTFMRQEIQLAKTEISEKISSLSKNAVALAAGGLAAYAGLILLLAGVGFLLAYAFEAAGLQPRMALFLGFIAIGILVAGIGGAFLAKAISGFSKGGLTPDRTLQTLKHIKGGAPIEEPIETDEETSSEEIQIRVEQTENRIGETLDELGERLSPAHINQELKHKISERPYSIGLVAMATGLVSGLWLTRKPKKA